MITIDAETMKNGDNIKAAWSQGFENDKAVRAPQCGLIEKRYFKAQFHVFFTVGRGQTFRNRVTP